MQAHGPRPDDGDETKETLTAESERMLEVIDELRGMEVEKRRQPISTPEFHRLAEDITATSRAVFRMAAEQEETGDETSRGEETIDDLAGDDDRGEGDATA